MDLVTHIEVMCSLICTLSSQHKNFITIKQIRKSELTVDRVHSQKKVHGTIDKERAELTTRSACVTQGRTEVCATQSECIT